MESNGTTAKVSQLPTCDVHRYEKFVNGVPALYDARTTRGPWAHMCQECFDQLGIGLGRGKGQRLEVMQ